ncbi:hypothetical protein KIN20_026027 [Parelaphostrongylus tenuis]|uniref:Uncharacterized protein n=1 Tax=Parelaphostrongylus tenuis TaxID=148309 RepID=A0AAD5QXV2_PARTN|nr:hypothetical protein KIN20_026027 [Parelaphostrongylus tenuis]
MVGHPNDEEKTDEWMTEYCNNQQKFEALTDLSSQEEQPAIWTIASTSEWRVFTTSNGELAAGQPESADN